MPSSYYPQTILTSSKIKPVWYPERAARRPVRLPGGINYPAGQILYETLTAQNAVQTLTFGGTITGGTITLLFPNQLGYDRVPQFNGIAYSATAATLRSNIQAAFDAYLGPSQVVVVSSGGGVFTITYSGSYVTNQDIAIPNVVNNLTGSSPTCVAAQTTQGLGGIGFYEPYVAGNPNSVTAVSFAVLEANTVTALNGDRLDQFGDTGEQTIDAFIGGYFLASQLTGLDTTLVSNTTYGTLGKWISGGWNTYPTLYTGSVIFIPGAA